MTAEALRSGGTGCGAEEYKHGMVRDRAQARLWRPHSGKQLACGQLKKCRYRAGQEWV